MVKALIGIASGSSWVVPSSEDNENLSNTSSVEFRWILIRAFGRMGQVYLMLSNAANLLNELNALLVSTRRTASN